MKKIAVFGATGGCAGYCLANALKAGYDCVALARTPAKLYQAMKDKHVSTEIVDRHLTVVEGNVKDPAAVRKALQINGETVDVIVSGIGSMPTFQMSLTKPVILEDATICRDAVKTMLESAHQLKPSKKPLLIDISTTGIAPEGKPRDVPLLFLPLYHWLLQAPHEDKAILKKNLIRHIQLPESERAISSFINVNPSLLLDGDGRGLDVVRQGIEDQPPVGYTIQRGDVGLWIFNRLLESEPDSSWLNNSVTITY